MQMFKSMISQLSTEITEFSKTSKTKIKITPEMKLEDRQNLKEDEQMLNTIDE